MKNTSMKISLSVVGLLFLNVSAYAQNKYILNFAENPPFTMMEGGKEGGVAVKIVAKAFEKAKINYVFQSVPLARAMSETKAKEYNCVFPVQRAQSNEAEYRWVSPIYIASSGLFAASDSKIKLTTLADAKALRVGALRGSGDAEYLKSFGYNVEEANTQDQNVKKLQGKQIDLWATDVLSAAYFSKQAGGSAGAPKEIYVFRKSLGSLACNPKVPKADVDTLQAILDGMIRDGSMKALTSE